MLAKVVIITEVQTISGRSSKTPTENLAAAQNETITDADETKYGRQAPAANQTI